MPHGMLKAAAGRVSMPPSRPRCTIIGDRCPRNRDQDSDTTQDQQVAHTASSKDSQASSPFLFDQATGLPCKFNLNLESECFILPMISGRSLLPRQPRSAQILTADSVQQQPIAAPEGSEINHGIHRNTRKRESESLPWHRRSSYEPDAPARGVPQSPRWRVGLVCAKDAKLSCRGNNFPLPCPSRGRAHARRVGSPARRVGSFRGYPFVMIFLAGVISKGSPFWLPK